MFYVSALSANQQLQKIIHNPGYVLLRTGFCNDHNTLAQAIEKKPTQYQSNIPQALINQSLFLAKYTDMPSQVTA